MSTSTVGSTMAPTPAESQRMLVALERGIRQRLRQGAGALSVLRGAPVEGPDTELNVSGLAQLIREQNRPSVAVEYEGQGILKRLILLLRQRDALLVAGLPPATNGAPAEGGASELVLVERFLRAMASNLIDGEIAAGRVESGHLTFLSKRDLKEVFKVTVTYRLPEVKPDGGLAVREVPVTLVLDAGQARDWLRQESAPVPVRRVVLPIQNSALAGPAEPDVVERVPLQVRAVAGRCRVPLDRLAQVGRGSCLEFDCLADGPVELEVEGRVVARGDLVTSDGRYAVLVTEVVETLR